jgi:hypothetical protein
MGPDAEEARPALAGALKDPAAEVRIEAAGALADLGAPADLILPALLDELPRAGTAGDRALLILHRARLPVPRSAFPPLLKRLGEPETYRDGLDFLPRPVRRAALLEVLELLADPERSLLGRAVFHLHALDRLPPEAILALETAKGGRNHLLQSTAALLLDLRRDGDPRPLIAALLKGDVEDTLQALPLGDLPWLEAGAVLRRACASADPEVRRDAPLLLDRLGPVVHAGSSGPAPPSSASADPHGLTEGLVGAALLEGGEGQRTDSAIRLSLLGLRDPAPFLDALRSNDGGLRRRALESLERSGPISPSEVPVLIEVLSTGDRECRRLAADLLAPFGAGAREALPALRAAARSRWMDVRQAARIALVAIEPSAR